MPIFEARPGVVERTSTFLRRRAVPEFGGSLSESGFGMSIPALPGPDTGSQAGGGGLSGTRPAHGGGCACGFG
jgi:hypothetical protein